MLIVLASTGAGRDQPIDHAMTIMDDLTAIMDCIGDRAGDSRGRTADAGDDNVPRSAASIGLGSSWRRHADASASGWAARWA